MSRSGPDLMLAGMGNGWPTDSSEADLEGVSVYVVRAPRRATTVVL
ncbi:hypothetical protein [Streptomyces sp. NBC_01237]|nr:hypothetical protein [Streptomyces sp. NBC_01237]WRZ76478.1 hypothetical protein OG251_35385 [Streptomyces sp. NBC_01237]